MVRRQLTYQLLPKSNMVHCTETLTNIYMYNIFILYRCIIKYQDAVEKCINPPTLLSFERAAIRSAHSLVFSKPRSAFSTWEMYARYLESPRRSISSVLSRLIYNSVYDGCRRQLVRFHHRQQSTTDSQFSVFEPCWYLFTLTKAFFTLVGVFQPF